MEYLNWIIIGIFALFLLKRLIPSKGVKNITTAELKPMLTDKDIQFIDVRTPGEFKGRHIKEFKNIPLDRLSHEAEKLSKDKEIVVLCQSGMRSNKAAQILKKLGFTTVTNVKGGMSAWF